jgi:hypothetical protein
MRTRCPALLGQERAAQAGVATAWFVGEPLQSLLDKTFRPPVDKATADPNRGGDGGDRHPISQE